MRRVKSRGDGGECRREESRTGGDYKAMVGERVEEHVECIDINVRAEI